MTTKLLPLVALAILAACARSAPELPPDYGSSSAQESLTLEQFDPVEAALDCEAIDKRMAMIKSEQAQYEARIRGNRSQNQAATYIGSVLFLPALLATEGDHAAKKELDRLQAQWDRMTGLKRLKDCG